MTGHADVFRHQLSRRRRLGKVFAALCLASCLVAMICLAVLIVQVLALGAKHLSLGFLDRFPSVLSPASAGVKSALWGTIWLICLTGLISVPVGVGAAIYLHEYARQNFLTRLVQINIANLAGVPSIVYGILGLAVFAESMHLGHSILVGALTLSLLILPVVIIAGREALAAVPSSIRQASYALGATRWQTIWWHVLPAALPGIMTGIILALCRAIGEAAPLIVVGAATYVAFVPRSAMDQFTSLPIQIFDWSDRPQAEFHSLAAAGIVVLLVVLFTLNLVAIGIRAWHQRNRLS